MALAQVALVVRALVQALVLVLVLVKASVSSQETKARNVNLQMMKKSLMLALRDTVVKVTLALLKE